MLKVSPGPTVAPMTGEPTIVVVSATAAFSLSRTGKRVDSLYNAKKIPTWVLSVILLKRLGGNATEANWLSASILVPTLLGLAEV